jgi:cysteinyl-tRNA synthetase
VLQIHNSLSGRKEAFQPLHPPRVGMYVCGVTVYDYCHVGHARCYVAFDIVRRWLRERGFAVCYVRNITDIDDKIIRRAAENGESTAALAQRFTAAMHADFAALAIEPPDYEPRATDYIPAISAMIQRLLARGYAYIGGGGDVFYAVDKFPQYGRLSGKRIEDLRAGARVEINENKRDPLDFVLWKRGKSGEPQWDSPWGAGRPGWHIECSAMAGELLGEHFDLHGGGMDLKFPHHENEIAQSCAANAAPFVNVWVHNGFVNVNEQKMSKSLGNFFTVREVLPYLRHPEVLRTFLLASHYRGPINYSPAQLVQADAALTRLYTALRELPLTEEDAARGAAVSAAAAADAAVLAHRARFETALDDDFNTPEALAALQGLARELNAARAAAGAGAARVPALAAELRRLAGVLGLLAVPVPQWFRLAPARALETADLETAEVQQGATQQAAAGPGAAAGRGVLLDEAQIEALIAERRAARGAGDYAAADRIRKQLREAGVLLEDLADRTVWRRA